MDPVCSSNRSFMKPLYRPPKAIITAANDFAAVCVQMLLAYYERKDLIAFETSFSGPMINLLQRSDSFLYIEASTKFLNDVLIKTLPQGKEPIPFSFKGYFCFQKNNWDNTLSFWREEPDPLHPLMIPGGEKVFYGLEDAANGAALECTNSMKKIYKDPSWPDIFHNHLTEALVEKLKKQPTLIMNANHSLIKEALNKTLPQGMERKELPFKDYFRFKKEDNGTITVSRRYL